MQNNISFQILFNGYFKDIYEFYKPINGINAQENGVIIFNKIYIKYDKSLDSNVSNIGIADCVLELFVKNNIEEIEKKLLDLNSVILNRNLSYILAEDPSGLKVKINFTQQDNIPYFKIPYSLKTKNIDNFYNSLEVKSKDGVLFFENMAMHYYSEKEKTQILSNGFEFCIFSNKNPQVIKETIKQNGGTIVDDVDNFLARLIVAHDPAKLTLTIYFDVSEDQKLFKTQKKSEKCCQSIFSKLLKVFGLKS